MGTFAFVPDGSTDRIPTNFLTQSTPTVMLVTNAFGPSSHFRACRPKKIENNLTRLNKSSCKKQKLSMEQVSWTFVRAYESIEKSQTTDSNNN